MIRPATPEDRASLLALATATGLFQAEEAEELLGGVLDGLYKGELGEGHEAQVWVDGPDGPPGGWVYFSPDNHSERAWQLWWIGVAPARQSQGIGGELLRFVEEKVRAAGGKLLIIETSSMPSFEPTRAFYTKRGYKECGCVPDFYADGDGKVIFAKGMPAADAES